MFRSRDAVMSATVPPREAPLRTIFCARTEGLAAPRMCHTRGANSDLSPKGSSSKTLRARSL